jgi:hypothetical protein
MQTKKHLKNVEIDVRKMAEKLRDIKRTLAFDDQAPVDRPSAASRHPYGPAQRMFANDKKDKKEMKPGSSGPALGLALLLALPLVLPVCSPLWAQRRRDHSIRWKSISSATPCST